MVGAAVPIKFILKIITSAIANPRTPSSAGMWWWRGGKTSRRDCGERSGASIVCNSPPSFASLDSDALRKIARLIDVATARDGGVVGEQLKWYDAQQRLQRLDRVGDVYDMIGVARDVLIAFGG